MCQGKMTKLAQVRLGVDDRANLEWIRAHFGLATLSAAIRFAGAAVRRGAYRASTNGIEPVVSGREPQASRSPSRTRPARGPLE